MAEYPIDLQHVAIYLRKSRADLEAEARGEGETLSKHRRHLMALARKYRYSIEDVYEEIVSGERIVDRPEMQKLLHAVEERRYTAVLCMDMDRLGRGDMIDQGLIQRAFRESGTLIITPRKVYNLKDELDEEWSEFEAFMARRELKIITRRLQRGRRDSAAEGKHIARKPPYGYLRDENLHLYPDPETAPVVRMIFEMAAQGHGQQAICNRLMELGIPSPLGSNVWERSTIYQILKNPVYRGHIVWGQYKYHKTDKNRSGTMKVRQSQDAWIIKRNAHEPLVDEETYRRYLEVLGRRPRITDKRELANPMASLLYCAECGHAMRYRPAYGGRKHRLLCTTFQCPTRSGAFDLVHDRLLQTLREMLDGMKIEAQMTKDRPKLNLESRVELLQRRVKSIEETINTLRKQRDNLHDLLEQGVYDTDTFLERSRVLSERMEAAQEELRAAQEDLKHAEEEQKKQEELIPKLAKVLDAYDRAKTAADKNALLKQVIDRVMYRRRPEWRKPDQFELEVFLRV